MQSPTEENYLKCIYKLSLKVEKKLSTNAIAQAMCTTAASVSDMLKRLDEKKLIKHEPYKGVTLTNNGRKSALITIRKHRLWELYLVNKMNFGWHEVHELAEQLEHIQSDALIDRINKLLGNPMYDPHGDPIPDCNGEICYKEYLPLRDAAIGNYKLVGVKNHDPNFLKYLSERKLTIGSLIQLVAIDEMGKCIHIKISGLSKLLLLSHEVATGLLIEKVK